MRAGNGFAGSSRRQAWGWRGRSQIGDCRGGFGNGSGCMGTCAVCFPPRRSGFGAPGPIAPSSDRISAALNAIAMSARITKMRSRSAVDGLPGSVRPVRHCRMGAARSSTRNPARAMAFRTAPRRLVAVTRRSSARIAAVRCPWMVRAAAIRARPSAEGPVLAPPCMRQRPFFIAGARQGQPARVLAPQRGAAFGLPLGLPLRSVLAGWGDAASGCKGICAHGSIWGCRAGSRMPTGVAAASESFPPALSESVGYGAIQPNGTSAVVRRMAARTVGALTGLRFVAACSLFILRSYDKTWYRGKDVVGHIGRLRPSCVRSVNGVRQGDRI